MFTSILFLSVPFLVSFKDINIGIILGLNFISVVLRPTIKQANVSNYSIS